MVNAYYLIAFYDDEIMISGVNVLNNLISTAEEATKKQAAEAA
ncbi:hypothetical protein ACFO3A_13585 [Comamonas nitrativorans]|uniref:Uncharacterized protein n=1 Tax=Comamonas nitrativorans TaxID=108437 RepID=A0ABV9H1H0_9BURK